MTDIRTLALVLAASNMGAQCVIDNSYRAADITPQMIGAIVEGGHSEERAEEIWDAEVSAWTERLALLAEIPSYWAHAERDAERLEGNVEAVRVHRI